VASHSPGLIMSICSKAALMAAGRILAIGPVQDVFNEYYSIIHGAPRARVIAAGAGSEGVDHAQAGVDSAIKEEKITAIGTKEEVIQEYLKHTPGQGPDAELEAQETHVEPVWHLASFTADPGARHEWGGYGNEWAECIGGSVETIDGVVCERPEIHLPFRICLRFRLLKDSPHEMVPNFHLDDGLGHRVMVAFPPRSAPTTRGVYHVCCIIEPFVLNAGRYAVGLALSTYEPKTIVHLNAPYALRFEVVEWPGVDSRRYGWLGELPGATRLRLDWQYSTISESSTNSSSADQTPCAAASDGERAHPEGLQRF
jgi:hypothetical protein